MSLMTSDYYNEEAQEGLYLKKAAGSVTSRSPQPSCQGEMNPTYSEEVQEDIYLKGSYVRRPSLEPSLEGLELPVKHTFIHFDLPSWRTEVGGEWWTSAPGEMMKKSFHLKFRSMEEAHIRGECSPCAYFFGKVDGCRQGLDCSFCHLCVPGEVKRRKKEKVKALKEQARIARGEGPPSSAASSA